MLISSAAERLGACEHGGRRSGGGGALAGIEPGTPQKPTLGLPLALTPSLGLFPLLPKKRKNDRGAVLAPCVMPGLLICVLMPSSLAALWGWRSDGAGN